MEFYKKDGKTFQSLPVPFGICIGSNEYGKCLIATQSFLRGSKLYEGRCIEIDDSDNYRFVQVGEEIFPISHVHSVQYSGSNQKRQLYGFDGFMNHSCDPNTYSPAIEHSDSNFHYYDTIAVKDIHAGDEITTDYALFDYTCDGHEIETCLCQSNFCRGFMKGFRYLTLEQKVNVLDRVDGDLIAQFLVDNPAVRIVDLSSGSLEEGLEWATAVAGELVVTKDICEGSRLMHSPCIRVALRESGVYGGQFFSEQPIIIICKLDSRYKLLLQQVTSGDGVGDCNSSITIGLFSFIRSVTEGTGQISSVKCIFSSSCMQTCEVYATRNLKPNEALFL